MAKKNPIREMSGVSKFVDAFFTGLRNNTAKRMIAKASGKGVDTEIIKKMKEIDQNNEELKDLIQKYSK